MKNREICSVVAFLCVILALPGSAQIMLSGVVSDGRSEKPLVRASITLRAGKPSSGRPQFITVQTSQGGRFTLKHLPAGKYLLTCTFVGYQPYTQELNFLNDLTIEIRLLPATRLTDEVLVRSTRAADRSGTAFTMIGHEQIEKENLGKDLPYLLQSVPSAVASSDGGLGVGYTALRIRGSDPTSTNVTINGIPYNDAESLGTYFVDVADLASSIQNIQAQRGAGSSTNGAGAFGASLNIQTENPSNKAFLQADASAGSFATYKTTLKLGTGLLKNNWVLEGRLSHISTNGYVERAFARLSSFFITTAHYGRHDLLRLNVFSGKEKTYQAWNGVPEDTLPVHRRYNSFTYPNQTDNYWQTHYQALYSSILNDQLTFNSALHMTHGKGYYEEFEGGAALSDYGLDSNQAVLHAAALTKHGDTTNLVRRQWLDNYFAGVTWSLLYKPQKAAAYTLGGAINDYRGLHFGEIISTANALAVPTHYRYYDNSGLKRDFNVYAKGSYILGKSQLSADLQYRMVRYRFFGLDEFRADIAQVRALSFFNPKVGLDLQLTNKASMYFSAAVASKEPNRDDYVQALNGLSPKPEKMLDFEGGLRKRDSVFSFSTGLYYMYYHDQLVLTGKVNDVGNPVRTNVSQSHRAGLETEASWRVLLILRWSANFCLSQNEIKAFNEVLYDESGNPITVYHQHTPIAFSPSMTAYNDFNLRFLKGTELDLIDRFVGKQFLDDTGNETRKLRPYVLTDLRLRHSFRLRSIKQLTFSVALNNIGNKKYESAGLSYPYVQQGKVINSNYYFPQAGFNMLFGLSVRL